MRSSLYEDHLHCRASKERIDYTQEYFYYYLIIMAVCFHRDSCSYLASSFGAKLEKTQKRSRIRTEMYECISPENVGKEVGLNFLDEMYGLRMVRHECYGDLEITIAVDRRLDSTNDRQLDNLIRYMNTTPIRTIWIDESIKHKSITVKFIRRPFSLDKVLCIPKSFKRHPTYVHWRISTSSRSSLRRHHMPIRRSLVPGRAKRLITKHSKPASQDLVGDRTCYSTGLEHYAHAVSHQSEDSVNPSNTNLDVSAKGFHVIDTYVTPLDQRSLNNRTPPVASTSGSGRESDHGVSTTDGNLFAEAGIAYSQARRQINADYSAFNIPPPYRIIGENSADHELNTSVSVEITPPCARSQFEIDTAVQILHEMALGDPDQFGYWAEAMAKDVVPLLCRCQLDHWWDADFVSLAEAIHYVPSRNFVGQLYSHDDPLYMGYFQTEYFTADDGVRKVMLHFKTHVDHPDSYSDQEVMTGDILSLMTCWRIFPSLDGECIQISTPMLRWDNGRLHPTRRPHTFTVPADSIKPRKYKVLLICIKTYFSMITP